MTQTNKITPLIQQQFPDFFYEDGETFIDFIKAYYEWLEQQENSIYETSRVLSYRDIDDTLERFVAFFVDEVIPSIPDDVVGDKRLFIKYAINLYRGKASEASYKLLFRLLYDEDISIYYPTEDILRVSDGRWVEESSIRLANPSTGNLDQLEGQKITGLQSGATATVDRIARGEEAGLLVRECFLINIRGKFLDNEIISNQKTGDDLIRGTVVSFTGEIFDISPITFRGVNHRSGDRITISGAGGSGANGTVISTAPNSAVEFKINDGGSGYRVGEETVIVSGPGVGADFEIDRIINTEFVQFNTDTIDPVHKCTLNTTPYFISDGSNTATVSNTFATANVTTQLQNALYFANVEVGEIASLKTLDSGSGYTSLPSVTVRDDRIARLRISDGSGGIKGDNADIEAQYISGAITEIEINEPGLSVFNKNLLVTITNLDTANTQPAKGYPKVTGVRNYAGKYVDTKGFISWNPKIQDNYFYQKFSYVINSKQNYNKYRRFVQSLLHPTGTKLFGTVLIEDVLNTESQTSPNTVFEQTTTKFTKATGTISVSNGSVNVTGNGTSFTTELSNTSDIKIVSGLYKVDTVSNNTSLTLNNAYEGNTASGVTFYYANTI